MASDVYFIDEAAKKRFKRQKLALNILTYTFLTICALFMLLPFYYMIITSLKTPETLTQEMYSKTLNLFPSFKQLTFENYKIVIYGYSQNAKTFAEGNFLRYYANTIFVAVCSTAITVVTCILSAFAFARLNFKGKNFLFALLLATMMIPGEMMIITNFTTISLLKWKDTYQALILTHAVSVFYIYYLRQTFQQIPNELFLAAKVDGYGVFKYLFKVMIPIAMPTIVTIIILSVMGSWNAYLWPTMVTSKDSMKLVANGLMDMFASFQSQPDALLAKGYEYTDNLRLAGSFMVTLPLFVFFLIFRKYIMRGVSRSGIKG
ncbi:MAG: carbohydrate ABC transporter permease [Erysipelotrichales bacterium]|nr:carbohydrate ABC transporter permease [Erysipelotrichales bacterium]